MANSAVGASWVAIAGMVCALTATSGSAAPKPVAAASTQIAACVKKKSGAMRLLPQPSRRCTRTERKVTWSVAGPPGATGPAGPPGAAGAAGASGGLLAAFASGSPTINTSADWTTVLSTSFAGAPGMLYSIGYNEAPNSEGACPNADPFYLGARVLVNGSDEPGWFSWRPRTGTVSITLQVRAQRNSGNTPCGAASSFDTGYMTLFATATRAP